MKQRILNINERTAILEILANMPTDFTELALINRKVAKKFGVEVSRNSDIILIYREEVSAGRIKENDNFLRLLRRRSVRTMSGVAPVAVLTKPFACPGKCAYCPTEKDVPQSYLSNEPAVMRAIRCDYEPYTQVDDRLKALENNGHEPTKIELIVIGGTWSVLPPEYKYWYIASCFAAANDYRAKGGKNKISKKLPLKKLKELLQIEQKKNERARYQIIGLTLETRPDYIDDNELIEMRQLGCTRVELGVQAIDDEILKLNKRGHGIDSVVKATVLLRNYGFKITYHLMPGLPGSTPKKDLSMFKQLFNDSRFQPDQIKFYPTVVTRGSLLYKWWQQGKYKPYTDKQLEKLIIDCKKLIPSYVRIIRLIRDIPGESIVAGNTVTNLRQVMQQKGVECSCIRCREAREIKAGEYKLKITEYDAGLGREFFIEYCSVDEKVLYGFSRVYLARDKGNSLNDLALLRELHVYGELVSIGDNKKVQHSGLGKRLVEQAELIAKENNFSELAIISGVGVRAYYRKLGYKLKETYMRKKLKRA